VHINVTHTFTPSAFICRKKSYWSLQSYIVLLNCFSQHFLSSLLSTIFICWLLFLLTCNVAPWKIYNLWDCFQIDLGAASNYKGDALPTIPAPSAASAVSIKFGSTTLARKYDWPKTYYTSNFNPKANNIFGLAKWCHFSSKCTDTIKFWIIYIEYLYPFAGLQSTWNMWFAGK